MNKSHWTSGPQVLGSILLQKEGRNLLPLPWQKQLKSLEMQELQQIMSALQQEMKSRQEASLAHPMMCPQSFRHY